MPSFLRSPLLPALVYLVLALPVVVMQVFATGPFQVPDEGNHFLRVVQIAGGGIFGEKLGDSDAGGPVDPAATQVARTFDGLHFNWNAKVRTPIYRAAAAVGWSHDRAFASFPNTAIYPAFLYAPAVSAVVVARRVGLSVITSLYLARLATALVAVGLSTLALALCGKGRMALFTILSFPMVLHLYGSVSQDALSLSCAALAIALWSNHAARDTDMHPAVRCLGTVLLGMVISARVPLLPLYALSLVPTARQRRPFTRSWLRPSDLGALLVGCLPIILGIVGSHRAKIPFRLGENVFVSVPAQLAYIGAHPAELPGIVTRTIANQGLGFGKEMIGILGWLDTEFSPWFYWWVLASLGIAIVLDLLAPDRSFPAIWRGLLAFAAFSAVAAVATALYLAWTQVGAPEVDGIQGRYLLAPAMLLAIALPSSGSLLRLTGWWERIRIPVGAALCLVVGGVNLWMVPVTIMHRYYGP